MLRTAKSFNLSCVILLCKKLLMSLSLLRDHSAKAIVAGNVQNILSAIHTFGNISPSLNLLILFKRLNGVNDPSPKFVQCVVSKFSISSLKSSCEISSLYFFAMIAQAAEICCYVRARNLQRKPNILSILYAASLRVESPAIIASTMI